MRPIVKTADSVNAQRSRERRRILKGLGSTDTSGHIGAERFCDELRRMDCDPAAYGALAIAAGGRPRLETDETLVRTKRYHDLRRRGLGSGEASRGCKSEGSYRRALNDLAVPKGHIAR